MADDKDQLPMNSSSGSVQRSTDTLSGTEAADYARRLREMWPQGVHSDQTYLLGLAQFLMSLKRWQVEAICNPAGAFIKHHKFPPSIAEIHEWIKPPERKNFIPEREYNPGPNFTRQRLEREAEMRKQGIDPPEIVYKSRIRIEHPGDHDPHWLTHPDPNAPWRKQGSPSRELAKLLADDPDYQRNLATWRKSQSPPG